mmetsp:Transcript_47176/g.154509  ORF Transcript_47176/g.154509 Transcript_47176/m.154509 type:complete len:210 (-) Transcript_47176:150-779(-)
MRGLRLHLRRPLPPPSPGTPQPSTAVPRHSPLARCRPRPTRLLRPSPPRACCQRPRPHRSQRRREQFPPWNDARGESQWEHTSGRARVLWAFGAAVRSACAPGSDARHFSWRVHGGSLHPARPRPPQAQPHKRDSIMYLCTGKSTLGGGKVVHRMWVPPLRISDPCTKSQHTSSQRFHRPRRAPTLEHRPRRRQREHIRYRLAKRTRTP